MSSQSKVDKILECYRTIQSLKEEMGAAAAGGMTVGGGNIAGLPPDDPPVDKKKRKTPVLDFRRREYKKLNMFYKQAVKPTKGANNAGKGN